MELFSHAQYQSINDIQCILIVQQVFVYPNKKVFEKALDEPKYSSMYAQLCLRLSEEAPNFDDPGKTGNSVSKHC